MKKIPYAILLLVFLLGCKQNETKSQKEQDPKNKDYSLFENGLNRNDSTKIGQSIKDRLDFHKVPGVSIAIFENGNITWSKQYGVRDSESKEKVDSSTRFQAASIAKTLTAVGIMKLVEEFNLDIDKDVNQYLKSWKLDYGKFSDTSKVTIRGLLSHTGGINMSGFKGYTKSDVLPSTLDILNGRGNTDKIELDTIPNTRFSYSGGGYTILQAMIEDISEMSFQDYFENTVFKSLGMKNSTFNQFPKGNLSSAHDKDGITHPEKWIIYPELAAAGLWTTPSDLAKLCLSIDNSYNDNNDGFLSSETIRVMLKPVVEWSGGEFGLGLMLRGENEDAFYWHSGSNPGGYRSLMVNLYKKNTGIVILTNSNNGGALYNEILLSFLNFNDVKL